MSLSNHQFVWAAEDSIQVLEIGEDLEGFEAQIGRSFATLLDDEKDLLNRLISVDGRIVGIVIRFDLDRHDAL